MLHGLSAMIRRREAVEPAELVASIPSGASVIVPIANGEPVALLDALEARASQLHGVTVHQMHALRDRPYLHGASAGRTFRRRCRHSQAAMRARRRRGRGRTSAGNRGDLAPSFSWRHIIGLAGA